MAAVLPFSAVHPSVRAAEAMEQIDTSAAPQQRSWQPYQDNGGTVLAIAGKDFVVVAGDMRMSNGFSIMSRETSKIVELPGRYLVASGGMLADRNHLHNMLIHRLQWYEYRNKKSPSVEGVNRMLSNTLYSRRFFPLYTYNLLAGLDEQGRGTVFSYDVVGNTEQRTHVATGSAGNIVEPVLDAYVTRYNQQGKGIFEDISIEEAIDIAKDAMASGGEREFETGDDVELFTITKDGIAREVFSLKRD